MDGRDFSLENLSDPAALQSQKSFPVIWREQTAAGLKRLVFFILKASDSFFFFLFGFKGQLAAAAFIPTSGRPIAYMIPRWLKISQIPDSESLPSSCSLGLVKVMDNCHQRRVFMTPWYSSPALQTPQCLCGFGSCCRTSIIPTLRSPAADQSDFSLQQVLLIQEIILAKENIFIKGCEYGESPIHHH